MRHLRRVRLALPAALLLAPSIAAQEAPGADHHQHLFSPAVLSMLKASGADVPPVLAARDLVPLLDSAGIRRAVLLSVAYMYGSPSRTVEDEYAKVRAENDWTAAQAAEYPDRLIAFCGFNPLKAYALEELARCAADPNLRRGLKLHFGNSVVDYHNPEHIAQVRRVFLAANDRRMAIVAHLRASVTAKLPWGREEALIFLNELLPAAPDVVVQIAHLASAGSPQDEGAQRALEVFVDAVARNDPRTHHVYFDATTLGEPPTPENAQRWAAAIKRLPTRVLFGSDATTATATPGGVWTAMRRLLPLTDDEFRSIANNTPTYMQ